ncbi:hypothetical protein [Noviherbaspirillum pedocola]|uniref:Uncharacterized protein n=1 Tax=Noviherbaspirillum pedocola TaxID=2801341 RepID=A0A934W5H5_9BURK|nr:hypothetical protein [Noviherbaspirillum pedocola]MBK4733228.1 hypothetical protein [Noviherbaspirillum pedocola]
MNNVSSNTLPPITKANASQSNEKSRNVTGDDIAELLMKISRTIAFAVSGPIAILIEESNEQLQDINDLAARVGNLKNGFGDNTKIDLSKDPKKMQELKDIYGLMKRLVNEKVEMLVGNSLTKDFLESWSGMIENKKQLVNSEVSKLSSRATTAKQNETVPTDNASAIIKTMKETAGGFASRM